MRWGTVVDLKKCIACCGCVIACKTEHFLPPKVMRIRLITKETGKFPDINKMQYPVQCNQCEDSACAEVCPTGATLKREDGVVTVDVNKCTGCQHCVVACPYQQRTCCYGEEKEYFPGQGRTEFEIIGDMLYPFQDGTVTKCNFCSERIDVGLMAGLMPGIDRDATPACVNGCMVRARYFGDLDDPDSEVSRLIRERDGYCLNPQFDAKPSVFYID